MAESLPENCQIQSLPKSLQKTDKYRAYHREYYARNKEKNNTYYADYYIRNRERYKKLRKARYLKNAKREKEQMRIYYQRNRTKILAKKKELYYGKSVAI
jgi:hypothetical protein